MKKNILWQQSYSYFYCWIPSYQKLRKVVIPLLLKTYLYYYTKFLNVGGVYWNSETDTLVVGL